MVNHPGRGAVADVKRVQRNQGVATMQNTSISRANFTVRGGGHIIIENGGLDVTGSANISGTATINGLLTGSGTIDWYGPSIFRGTLNVTGNMATSGTLTVVGGTTLNGAVTMNNDLTMGTGRIVAGPIRIDKAGSYGGRVYSTSILVLEAGNAVLINNDTDIRGILLTDGLDVDGPKNFRISHPTKPGYWLRHGSTESPVSGIEYWGKEILDDDGQFVIELPDYFEALAKPEGRVPFATGRGFNADWSDIEEGKFTVTGKPGGRFSWQVKAERIGGDFLLEEEIPPEPTDDGRVGPWRAPYSSTDESEA